MINGWKEYKIKEIGTVVGGGTPKTSIPEYWGGNIPWISPKDLSNHTSMYISHGERNITELGLEKSSTKLLPAKTLLISSRAPIGYMAIALNEICTNQGFKSIVPKTDVVEPKFLYYLMKTKVDFLKSIGTGTTFAEISGNMLKNVDVTLPPLVEQKRIAEILGSLDDKIELNRRMNETLEEMAQAIFKSWFVDFEPVKAKIKALEKGGTQEDAEIAAMQAISGKTEKELAQLKNNDPESYEQLAHTASLFPSALQDSELGEIPEGWEVGCIGDLTEKISKGTTPRKSAIAKADDCADIPFLKVKDISNQGDIIRSGLNFIPASVSVDTLKRSILKTHDILVSIAGTIGRVTIVESDLNNSNCNQALAFIRLKNSERYLEYCRLNLRSNAVQNQIKAKVVQGVQANLSLAALSDLSILSCPEALIDNFNANVRSLFHKSRMSSNESRELRNIRDTILPKLLSGEISVADAEKEVGEVTSE